MLESIRDIFFARRNVDAPMDGNITFDLKLTRVDPQREDITRSFGSKEERDAFVEGYLAKPGKAKKIDAVIYEDTLIFWRRGGDVEIPKAHPHVQGKGELLLRVHGSNDTVLEATTNISMTEIVEMFTRQSDKFGWIEEMAMVRRRIVCERRSVLVKLEEIPASALTFDSADNENDE